MVPTPVKIGLLIPSTSNGRDWKCPSETYLFNTFTSFIKSLTHDEGSHAYNFYIGINSTDAVLDTQQFKTEFGNLVSPHTNVQVEYLYMDGINKGHLTIMWNRL